MSDNVSGVVNQQERLDIRIQMLGIGKIQCSISDILYLKSSETIRQAPLLRSEILAY